MKKSKYPFIEGGDGLHIKKLPATWALHVGQARCCAAVGFFTKYNLRITSYIVLN